MKLSCDQLDKIVKDKLYNNIKDLEDMCKQNVEFHHGDLGTFAPLYSWEFVEEDKKLNKLKKSFIKVYNYYSEVKYDTED